MSQTSTLENIFFTPINAIISADFMAAKRTADFINEYGFTNEKDQIDNDTTDVGNLKKTSFRYNQVGANGEPITKVMTLPTLSMIPLPLLHVDQADFDFAVRVIDTENDNKTKLTDSRPVVETKKIIATLAAQTDKNKKGNESSPHLDANIYVKVKVVQSDMPAGLSNLLALMGTNTQNVPLEQIIPRENTVKLEIGKGAESAITLKDPLTNLPIANELITVYYDESTELSLSSEKKHWGNGLAMVTNSQGTIPWVASIKNHGQVKVGMSQKVTFTHSNGSTCAVDIYFYEK
jgi:hypothetical protein